MSVKITCINKDNGDHYDPNEAITHLGWINEKNNKRGIATLQEMINFLENKNDAYVKDRLGNIAYLVVRISRFDNKFVKTIADGRESNNLLELIECKR